MAEEAVIKVRLDTRDAEKSLQKLGKEGAVTAGRVQERLQRKEGMGRGFAGGIGIGGGVGVAVGAALGGMVRQGMGGPLGDLAERETSFLGATISDALDGADSRAKRSIREDAKQMFRTSVGISGDTTAAQNWAQQVFPFRKTQAQGEIDIEKDLSDSFLKAMIEAGTRAADRIIERFSPGDGR